VEPVLQQIDTDYFELFLFNHWEKEEVSHVFSGYPFFSVHGSKYLCFVLEEDEEKGIKLLKDDIMLAYNVEAHVLVLHAYNSLNPSPNLDRIVKTFVKMQKFAEEHAISLSIELIPHKTIPIPELAAFFNTHLEEVSFTFDLEYTSKYECLDDLLSYSARADNIHVRDYDGNWIANGKRRYLKPLDGTLDFDAVFSAISRSGYDGTYTLEAPHKTVKEINFSMKWLTSSLRTHMSPSVLQGSNNHL
jgi:sugar phosphate isomerase/epimerase